MPFAYKMGTVSGSITAGGSIVPLIQQIGSFMQNSLGWSLVEDRTAQAGANSKYILKSAGETDAMSTLYFVMTSGTNLVGCQMATFWDTSTHTVGSGAATPAADTTVSLLSTEDRTVNYWISGDKDSFSVFSKVNATYDGIHCGFISPFNSAANDPWPVYLVGSNSNDVDSLTGTSANAHSFLNGTTILTSNEADWNGLYTSPLTSSMSPDNIFGATEKYVCTPMVAAVSDASPIRKSIRGISKNIWCAIGPSTTSLMQEDVFLVPSTGRTYQIFYSSTNSTTAAVIRRS